LLLTETLLPGLTKGAPPQRQDVERQLLAVPGDARLIVVIDDIDRSNAELMPHLLLALREVFNLPGCAFIVAFDPRTITDALPSAHPGWRSTFEFREKIIQFPFWLPTPTRHDILALAREEVKAFPGVVVDANALSEVVDLLPTNPRRLKDFFRSLWRLSPTLARHDASELKWMPLLLIELMLSLSPTATQALFQNEKFCEDLGAATFLPEDPKTGLATNAIKELREYTKEILTEIKCPDDLATGLLRLVDAFRDRSSMVTGSIIGYWAHLDDTPPILTWKEFNALVSVWRSTRTAAKLVELVKAQTVVIGCSVEAAYRELFETAVMYRGAAISRAVAVVLDEQIGEEMDHADIGLELLRIVVRDQQGFSCQPSMLTGAHFNQLLGQFSQWAHFRNHERYIAARTAERNLLLDAARDGASFASEIIESLRPWFGMYDGFSAERAELRRAVVEELKIHVFDDLFARFSRKDGISALWGKGRHLVEKHYLFRWDEGFYSETGVARLKEVADQARSSLLVQENFYEYLRLLVYGLKGNSEIVTPEELRPLAQSAEILLPAWRAATAQPLQPRVVVDLRDTWNILGRQLPDGQALALPSWWPAEPAAPETAAGVPGQNPAP
jgi:KAP family P-loop domain